MNEAGERNEGEPDDEVGEVRRGIENTEAEATAAAIPSHQLGMLREDAGSAAADPAASATAVDAAVAGA